MTCKEKFKLDYPDWNGIVYGIGCPNDYGYLDDERDKDGVCIRRDCVSCWNREIPEEKVVNHEDIPQLNYEDRTKLVEAVESAIKDSGDRTEFSTGAVRDMREGKGRCDLMPLGVVGAYYTFFEGTTRIREVLEDIENFQKTSETDYLLAALFKSAIFPKPETMFLEVAKHFEDGAKKYGEYNWQKGIPVNCYIDSAVRHYLKFLRGDTDERHDRAFVWNILCCIWTVENKPELNNYRKDVN